MKKLLILENARLQGELDKTEAERLEWYNKWSGVVDDLNDMTENATRIHKDKMDAEKREKAWKKMAEHVNAIMALLPQVDDSGTFTPPAAAAASN